MVGIVLAGTVIQKFGTDEQKSAHLRATLAAEQVWCQLFSEPGAGSDLGGLATRAERDGERWIVNGQKVWCSGGRYSGWGILMARTDPDAPKHKGISFFLMDMGLPGIEVRPLRQMTGEAEFDEVFFTDVEMPIDALIGPENEGWMVGMATLTSERGHIGASIIGLERRLEQIAAMGGDDLGIVEQDRLADLLARGNAFRAMALRQGPIASTAGSLMKLGITELMFEATMLRGDLAGAECDARGTRRRGHARCARRPHRRRHEPSAAQHHRGATAGPPPRTQVGHPTRVLREITRQLLTRSFPRFTRRPPFARGASGRSRPRRRRHGGSLGSACSAGSCSPLSTSRFWRRRSSSNASGVV